MHHFLHLLLLIILAGAGEDVLAGAFQFTDGTYSFVVPAGDCYTVGRGYLAQVQGVYGSAYAPVLSGCTVTSGVVSAVSWDKWKVADGTHAGPYSASLTQTRAFDDVPGAPFTSSDFTFVFATIFCATLGLYFLAYAIGMVLRQVRGSK